MAHPAPPKDFGVARDRADIQKALDCMEEYIDEEQQKETDEQTSALFDPGTYCLPNRLTQTAAATVLAAIVGTADKVDIRAWQDTKAVGEILTYDQVPNLGEDVDQFHLFLSQRVDSWVTAASTKGGAAVPLEEKKSDARKTFRAIRATGRIKITQAQENDKDQFQFASTMPAEAKAILKGFYNNLGAKEDTVNKTLKTAFLAKMKAEEKEGVIIMFRCNGEEDVADFLEGKTSTVPKTKSRWGTNYLVLLRMKILNKICADQPNAQKAIFPVLQNPSLGPKTNDLLKEIGGPPWMISQEKTAHEVGDWLRVGGGDYKRGRPAETPTSGGVQPFQNTMGRGTPRGRGAPRGASRGRSGSANE